MKNDFRYFRLARRSPAMYPQTRRMLARYEGVVNTIVQLRRTYACDVINPRYIAKVRWTATLSVERWITPRLSSH